VADTFDAITSARPYRPAARHKQAIDVLIENAGTQLDPEVVRAFLRCYAGRRASVMWIILAVSPQRALAWMRHGSNGGEPVPVVPVGELAASTIGRAIVFAAAVGTSVGVGVARYENHVLRTASALPVAAAAPFSYQLKPSSPGHPSAAKQAPAKGSPTIRFAVDRAGRPIAKGSRAQVRARKPHAANAPAVPGSSTTGPGAPTPGSTNPTTPPGNGNVPAAISPGHKSPAGGGGHTSPTSVTAPAPAPAPAAPPAAPAPATPATTVNGPTSTPPVPTPPPPVTTGSGGGTTTGGGGSGGGGTGGHHHGGPGDGGWGPPGHPHNGPGDGGWGPGGNPDPGGPHGGKHGLGLGLVLRLP
jgi:uncharacterized membrane protein YgcG